MQQASTIRAVIDIGSNTLEVLVARCQPNELETIEHRSTLARLGESVNENGEISSDKTKTAVDTVREYQELAKQRGAEQILALATEALREASNKQEFLDTIKREAGVEVQLISGYAEAALDYYGATCSPNTPLDAGVLDVGGGSTEIVTAKNGQITWLTSVPIGSGAIHDRYLHSDPATYQEMEAARSYLAHYMQTLRIPAMPPALVVTGSSASSLLKLAQHAFKLDENTHRMTHSDLSACLGLLNALPAEEIAKRFEQKIERARILAAGALVIQAVMQYVHLDEIHISSQGVREGAVHDNDVLIALLRLCLGSEDAGLTYEQALVKAGKRKSKEKLLLPSDMVTAVLAPDVAPDAAQRYGLEQLLLKQSQLREEHYQAFRRHWHQLQARDFRRELLDLLSDNA